MAREVLTSIKFYLWIRLGLLNLIYSNLVCLGGGSIGRELLLVTDKMYFRLHE